MWVNEKDGEGGGGSESEGEGVGAVGMGKGGTKIAWRYERMKKFQTTISTGTGSGEFPHLHPSTPRC
jgi:hypothetical protein